jgi:hypothetical protein
MTRLLPSLRWKLAPRMLQVQQVQQVQQVLLALWPLWPSRVLIRRGPWV